MEQDYIAGLYQSLGMSVGVEFSSEDVSLLYRKVFHVPSSTNEARAAIKKVAGGDNSGSCDGENVLDVLLEMEKERGKKEMMYWDLQLLNSGNLYLMMDCLQQSTDPSSFKMAYNSDSGSLQPHTTEMDSHQIGKLVMNKELNARVTSVKRLKKAARQCWARLASEGVQSMLRSPWQRRSPEIRSQAWGCVSLSDLLLLVEVKYDVVTNLLYTEMLQEHYTESVWEMLLPWQQNKEVERLDDLAEEALESVDMLHMAELPGAFRIYKAYLGESVRSCPESNKQSWSAVSFLSELHAFRQQELHTLTVLTKRLHGERLTLLCLHITLATLRAQREKQSYRALLSARQSWEAWPQVNSQCRAEQVALLLYGEEEKDEEEEKEDSETLQQQAVLQLLVLTQEQERKHLVRLVHGVSLEDLQGPRCTVPPDDDSQKQAALRNGCIKRLRQIHAQLQTHNGSKTPIEQTDPKSQVESHGEWSQHQLEECALLLLTQLMELQEVQASALLEALVDKNAQCVQALRDKYQSEIQAQQFTNLIHLLISDHPHLTENGSNEEMADQSCYSRQAEDQNGSGGSAEAQRAESFKRANTEMNEASTTDRTDKQDVCSGCGAVMEDLPYLEILCVSDAKNDALESLAAEGGARTEDESGAAKSPQSYEKQGSLITLAWSKPPEDDTDVVAEAADGATGQSPDTESNLKTQIQPTQCQESDQKRAVSSESLNPSPLQSGAAGHCDAQSADQECGTAKQVTLNKRPIAHQPHEGEAVSDCDQRTHAMVAESLQVVQPHLLADSSETNLYTDDLCSGTSDDTANADGEVTEVEMCHTAEESELWDLRGPKSSHHEDQKYSPKATVDRNLSEKAMREATLMESNRVREPVSAVERERTMRNLVDMQRKFEQKQQRDRERQLLRVQERLSIIQNRKAEEDLLGLKHTDRLKHLTQDLPLEDKNQQKTIVRERLEQLRRERSYIMQSKRDRNTAGFKELLGPVALHSREMEQMEDGAEWDTTV